MSRHEQKIKDGVACLLEDGETVLAAVIAAPRGSTQQAAGSMHLGSAQRARALGAAEQVALRLDAPMALSLTQRRLLTLKIGTPLGLGIGGAIRDLMSAVPIQDVDSIVVKRLALGYTITRTVRGGPSKPTPLRVRARSPRRSTAPAPLSRERSWTRTRASRSHSSSRGPRPTSVTGWLLKLRAIEYVVSRRRQHPARRRSPRRSCARGRSGCEAAAERLTGA